MGEWSEELPAVALPVVVERPKAEIAACEEERKSFAQQKQQAERQTKCQAVVSECRAAVRESLPQARGPHQRKR